MKTAEEWYAEGGLNNDAAEIQHRRAIQADALREAAEIAAAHYRSAKTYEREEGCLAVHDTILARVKEQTSIGVVTELMDTENADAVEQVADVIQIGARNMQNFSLLRCVSHTRKPVLLKRGLAATLEEWLMAAEYVMAGGNYNVCPYPAPPYAMILWVTTPTATGSLTFFQPPRGL